MKKIVNSNNQKAHKAIFIQFQILSKAFLMLKINVQNTKSKK